jgi:hypothetical protein
LIGGIIGDFEKAFNCMNHDILLSKLGFHGFASKADALIKSYSYRRVLIDNRYYSTIVFGWGLVKLGFHQVSILDP